MMRIYKTGYTVPKPAGATILNRKGGKVARWRDRSGQQREAPLTKSGDRVRIETTHYSLVFEDHLRIKRTLKAYTDRAATQRLADFVQRLVNAKRLCAPLDDELLGWVNGLDDSTRELLTGWDLLDLPTAPDAGSRKVSDLVDAFEDWLRSTKADSGFRRNRVHIITTMTRIRSIVEGCGFQTWSDIAKQPVEIYLGGLSLKNRTHNGYVAAIKQFCTWVVDSELAEYSPLDRLKRVRVTQVEKRRPLTFDEMCRLLTVAQNGPVRHGLTGPQRAVLYLLGATTGLRRNELFHLTADCFNLDKATVRLSAAYCKSRRKADLPLTLSVAARLNEFLGAMKPKDRLFPLAAPRTAQMIQGDAIEARLPLTDDEGRELVFHSLRHTLRTELVNAHVGEEIVNALMRHAPKGVGQQFYGHVSDFQKREALSRLPDYPWPTDLQQNKAAATGTDGNFLSESYSGGGQMRTPTEASGRVTVNGRQKPAIVGNERELARISNP